MKTDIRAEYDSFAWFYNKYWGNFNLPIFITLKNFLSTDLGANAKILDLCCGTGQLAKRLYKKGYEVTGIDISSEMIYIARENVPEVNFIVSDIRDINIDRNFDGIVSIFDSLNHLLRIDDLRLAFENANKLLLDDGIFIFDMLMEEGFKLRWTGNHSKVTDDYVYIDNSSYDMESRIGIHNFTAFYRTNEWVRIDAEISEKSYTLEEILVALKDTGFTNISYFDFANDLNVSNQKGRMLFRCKKS